MSRPIVRQLGAPFALAYLLAGWLAGALHSHTHVHAHEGESASTCSCGHHHCAPQHADESHDTPAEHEHDDHHCVVCDHLAKPPLPVVAVELDGTSEKVTLSAEPAAPLDENHVPLTCYSRGPPLV